MKDTWRARAGKRFSRLATRAVVAQPGLWRVLRPPMRAQFDRLADEWEGRAGPAALAPLAAALDRVETVTLALDLGTGTGKGARLLAARYPAATVVGVDIAPAMVEQARALLPQALAGRVSFEVADAVQLPFPDGSFDVVVLLNMIPFFSELARVTAPGGSVVFAFYSGPRTPIYVPPETLRARLSPLGFDAFEELAAGEGTALLARRASGASGHR
jgi:SAM-dependent methyltransferase